MMADPLFELGEILPDWAALQLIPDLAAYIGRHASGDWGRYGRHDAITLTPDEIRRRATATGDHGRLNALSILHGGRVYSSFDTPAGRLLIWTAELRPAGRAGPHTYTTATITELGAE